MATYVLVQISTMFIGLQYSAPASIDEVIANVEAHEKLYRNIEAIWGNEYELHDSPLKLGGLAKRSKRYHHCTIQDNLFRMYSSYEYETMDGTKRKTEMAYGYDGDTTRMYRDQIANVMPGKAPSPIRSFHPHALLLGIRSISNFPLSVWLRGGKGLQVAFPALYNDKDHIVTVVGGDRVDGLRCIKLRCELWGKQPRRAIHSMKYLWICPERNYLPVKVEEYNYMYSDSVIASHSEVTEWLELSHGIWLPKKWTFTSYNGQMLQETGKQVLCILERHSVDMAKLDPSYEKSFFADIKFPANAMVYEQNAKGEIIKSHLPGTHKPEDFIPGASVMPSSWLFWFLLCLAVVFQGCGTFFVVRRRGNGAPSAT